MGLRYAVINQSIRVFWDDWDEEWMWWAVVDEKVFTKIASLVKSPTTNGLRDFQTREKGHRDILYLQCQEWNPGRFRNKQYEFLSESITFECFVLDVLCMRSEWVKTVHVVGYKHRPSSQYIVSLISQGSREDPVGGGSWHQHTSQRLHQESAKPCILLALWTGYFPETGDMFIYKYLCVFKSSKVLIFNEGLYVINQEVFNFSTKYNDIFLNTICMWWPLWLTTVFKIYH